MSTHNELVPMVIPTVMIPLTMASLGLSVLASFIASLFGIDLKWEGPKKILEVLLKPKVLASAFLLNAVIMGGYLGWQWWANYPKLLRTIQAQMQDRAQPSPIDYADRATVATQFNLAAQGSPLRQIDQLWRTETKGAIFRAPVVTSGRVFTGNRSGVVSEMDLQTGKVERTFFTGTMVSSEITIWKNKLIIGEGVHDTHHARIYRFDLKTGKYEASYQTKGHTEGQAVAASFEGEDFLLAVAGKDGLHAINPVTMEKRWHLNLGHMDAGVLVHEGRVFFGTGREKYDDKKNRTYAAAADLKTGEVIWKRELAASSWMRPVIIGSDVCLISGEIYFPTERGHVSCFNQTTGDPTIAHNTTDPLAGTPKVIGDSILFTSIHGQVCRFDIMARKNLWCFDTKATDISLAGASYDPQGHVVIYPSVKTGLYILNADTGALVQQWQPSAEQGEWKKTMGDVTVSDGLWVVADYEGSVRVLRPTYQ